MCEVMREMCIGTDDGLSQASVVHRHGVVVEHAAGIKEALHSLSALGCC